MADKKLEDYMNELQSYAKEDAHQKKKEYDESFKAPFVFPWTRVILGTLLVASIFRNTIYEKFDQLSQLEFIKGFQQVGKKMSSVKVTVSTGEEKSAASPQAVPSAGEPDLNPVHAPSAVNDGATNASSASAKNSVPPGDDMVRVQGIWMKRTPDNIYIIKGKRVLYIDERRHRK